MCYGDIACVIPVPGMCLPRTWLHTSSRRARPRARQSGYIKSTAPWQSTAARQMATLQHTNILWALQLQAAPLPAVRVRRDSPSIRSRSDWLEVADPPLLAPASRCGGTVAVRVPTFVAAPSAVAHSLEASRTQRGPPPRGLLVSSPGLYSFPGYTSGSLPSNFVIRGICCDSALAPNRGPLRTSVFARCQRHPVAGSTDVDWTGHLR